MLLTFGHGTATAERMTELLRGAGVAVLVDVRTAPGSRRHPHVARAELERWLPEAGISYRWDKRLGGFRKAAPDSPDTVWREDMFRGYAAHMRTEGLPGRDGRGARPGRRRPHGGDVRGEPVVALPPAAARRLRRGRPGRAGPASAARRADRGHRLSPGLRRRDDGLLVYDAGQESLL
jgi:Uncharacterized conserved protein